MNRAVGILHALAMTALVAGCGGGGGGDSGATAGTGAATGTVASTESFNLLDSYKARLIAGSNNSFVISGDCAGMAKIKNDVAAPATFEGVVEVGILQTTTVTFTNCTPVTSTVSGTSYFDASASYAPIGTDVADVEYSDLNGAPASPLPASVRVDDSKVYATLKIYSDSRKVVAIGTRALSYTIKPETANTVFVDLAAATSDITGNLSLTQTTRYRLASDGTLTLVSIDLEYYVPSRAHLLFTAKPAA